LSDTEKELTLEEAYKLIKKLITERDAKIMADMQWVQSNSTGADVQENQGRWLSAKFMQRNQVLFCVGHIDKSEFKYSDIEAFVRQRFPSSNQGTVLNVAHAMSELAGNTGILIRTPKGDGYMLKAPVFAVCLRGMLRCEEGSEMVEKVAITDL